MSDSFYHMTESSELNLKNKGPKHTHLAMFLEFLVGMTSWCKHNLLSTVVVLQVMFFEDITCLI